MNPDPIPERIALWVEGSLALITRAAGYRTDAGKNVIRGRESLETWNSFPVLFVEIGDEAEAPDTRADRYRTTLDVLVFARVKAPALTRRRDVFAVACDVRRAVLRDPLMTDAFSEKVARETRWGGWTTDVGTLGTSQLAEVALLFLVDYDWKWDDQ